LTWFEASDKVTITGLDDDKTARFPSLANMFFLDIFGKLCNEFWTAHGDSVREKGGVVTGIN
jgi:hypothetical protein